MRILLDNSGYELLNHGDVAMLQVAVERLRGLFPKARLQVITAAPERLAMFCPGAEAVPAQGRQMFLRDGALLPPLHRAVPEVERRIRRAAPVLAQRAIEARRGNKRGVSDLRSFLEAARQADFVVATGGGYLTDAFNEHGNGVLDLLNLSARAGKPTALLGQGIGPMAGRRMRANARAALAKSRLIALREGLIGPKLLQELGVPAERVTTTGDDAVEMAHAARPATPGQGIGVNLRLAYYSGVDQGAVASVKTVLQRASQKHDAPLLPVPISFHEVDSDAATIRLLLEGTAIEPSWEEQFQTPRDVIDQAGRCRVVVTGSYHAGVFALSQGVPVVGLAKSTYYIDKFQGLAHQFGAGCSVVLLDDAALEANLAAAIERAWDEADAVRPILLSAAQRQIAAGHAAYAKLPAFVAHS